MIDNRPFLLCTIRVGWQSRPLQKKKASFVEVVVAPITSSPHRMHVAYDEKMSMWLDSVINMLTRSVRTISTCSFVEMSFFALSHVPPVLLMDVGSWTLDTRTLDDKNPHKKPFQT